MDFPFGETTQRLRPKVAVNPYSNESAPGTWTNPDSIDLPGAFVGSSSTEAVPSATRTQALAYKSLYLTDPTADVKTGDRIVARGVTYQVNAIPSADVNPFTGWQPVKEIPLKEVLG